MSQGNSKTPAHPALFKAFAKEYGMNEYARKKIMGHDMNDVTDKHYTHLDIDYLSKEIEKIR